MGQKTISPLASFDVNGSGFEKKRAFEKKKQNRY